MAHEIHKVRVRNALAARREPYWGPSIANDLAMGFRKIDADRGTWIARLRVDRRSPHPDDPPTGRYAYESFGLVTEANDYEVARNSALNWRKNRADGVRDEPLTVADACRAYVEDRRKKKGEATARDSETRFARNIYKNRFGELQLEKVKTPTIEKWLEGLNMSAPTEKRTLTSVRAAVYLAVRKKRVSRTVQLEWRDVQIQEGHSKGRRDLFLDIQQRRALLQQCSGAIRDLVEAAALTGARAGELVKARRRQFDGRTGMMTLVGKTGRRDVPLSPAALDLFARLARSKTPEAFLLMRDDGRPWAHSDWDDSVRKAAKAAGLPAEPRCGVCLYTLRHSFITEALIGGMPTLEVARLVGTSVGMIEKHYGHLVASVARERLAKVAML